MKLPVIAAFALLCFSVARAVEPLTPRQAVLFSLHVQAKATGGERPLNITMHETERNPEFSLVEIEVESPGGGPSATLFLPQGFCGLMLARGQELAVAEQTSEHPIQFHVSFPSVAPSNEARGLPRMVLTKVQCAAFPR